MDKFCLKWNEFDTKFKDFFKKLRAEEKLFDVTLATNDGQRIQAHKIILSAGSNFFSEIFMESNHPNMLIYLKGINSVELNSVLDFIYNGETFVTQEEMRAFFETGKELNVKGLEGLNEDVAEKPKLEEGYTPVETESWDKNRDYTFDETTIPGSMDPLDADDNDSKIVVKMDENNIQVEDEKEKRAKINEIIEKNEGTWKCKVCGKISVELSNIKRHAETHIQGINYPCHICNKIYTTKNNL